MKLFCNGFVLTTKHSILPISFPPGFLRVTLLVESKLKAWLRERVNVSRTRGV
jgi:hypothetical protein